MKYGAKYVSLKVDDPYTITPERALEVIREKEIADANRLIQDFPEAGIQVLNGRYGPYITDKARNAKIPKDRDPKSLSLPECQALLAAAPVRSFGKGRWGAKGAKAGKGGKAAAKPAEAAPAAAPASRPAAEGGGQAQDLGEGRGNAEGCRRGKAGAGREEGCQEKEGLNRFMSDFANAVKAVSARPARPHHRRARSGRRVRAFAATRGSAPKAAAARAAS